MVAFLGGCFLSSDLSDTAFLCAEDPICPDGLTCVDGRCVSSGDGPDGGAGGGGQGSDADGGGGGGGGGDGVGGDADAGVLPPGFAFREQLTIDNVGRGELIDFPLLVVLDGDRIDYGAVRGDGGDVAFTDAGGAPLAHEIERWEPGGRSIVWVRVPRIEAGSGSTSIFMYYGDPEATVDSDQEAVWSAYEEVYHLDGSGGQIDDAAARDYDGTPAGGGDAPGFIGLGRSLDGFGQLIDLGGGRDFGRAAPGLTVEAWVHPQAAQQSVVVGAATGTSTSSRVELRFDADQTLRGGARTQDDGQFLATSTLEPLPLDDWSWVALVCDFEAGEVAIYINDHQSIATGGLPLDATTPDTPSLRAVIGANETLDTQFFTGLLDEVRIAPSALPPDWIAAQNASMRDQLVSYGAPEAL